MTTSKRNLLTAMRGNNNPFTTGGIAMLQAKGTTSLMIDEYADIIQQIESLTRRKDEIRETLEKKKQFQEANKIQSKTGIVLTITVRRGAEIAPDLSEVKYLFERKGRPELVEKVVTVAPKLLKKYLNEEEYNDIVLRKDSTTAWSISRP